MRYKIEILTKEKNMKLRDYLKKENIDTKDFAEKLECNHSYLNGVMKGKYRAGRRLARDILLATSGNCNVLTEKQEMEKCIHCGCYKKVA